MRFSNLCASALAAAAFMPGTLATVTITRTVARVLKTSVPTSSSVSMMPSSYGNGTQPMATGTGIWSSVIPSSTTQPVIPATGAAMPLRLDTLGAVAVAGIAGLAIVL